MVQLPPPKNRTVEAIYRLYEKRRKEWRRPHLGASLLGDENCMRMLWYSFRWARDPGHDGRILRLFETGDREEERIKQNLRDLGMRVEAVDPKTSEQWTFAFVGGHLGGSGDGAVLGVLEAPKTWHLLEVKTMNERRFRDFCKRGLRASQPGYFAQVQVCMLGLGLRRTYFATTHKDSDWIAAERPKFEREYARAMVTKGRDVIFAPQPPVKISEDPSWHECKLCSYAPVCHGREFESLERNCRTCTSSQPEEDGTWTCVHHRKTLTVEEQREGCGDHVFVPGILPGDLVDACEDERYAVYLQEDGTRLVDDGKRVWPI